MKVTQALEIGVTEGNFRVPPWERWGVMIITKK